MFRNYLTSALRALSRDRFHAGLNISGLAVSLAAALLIALYIQHELSYENFFTEPERVYRVEVTYQNKGQPVIPFSVSPGPTRDALQAEFPELATVTRLTRWDMVVTAGKTQLRTAVNFTDDNLLDVIDFPVLAGDADAALTQPGNVALTRGMALRLFGTEEAIGQTLRIGPEDEFRVAAILRDLPENTSFSRLGILTSEKSPVSLTHEHWAESWGNAIGYTFLRLGNGVRAEEIAGQLDGMVARRVPEDIKAFTTVSLSLRALPDIHLQAGEGNYISDHNETALYALGGTGVFLILIACFNYINLATARALLRIKEVGMRKILGGTTRQLVTQFLCETAITTLTAFLLALALAAVSMPVFANLVDRELSLATLATPGFFGWIAALLIFVSLAAGTYPAMYLASSQPVALFHNQKSSVGGRSLLRSVMVGVQFSLTVGLIIAATIVYSQVSYLKNFDLGIEKDGLLMIDNMPTGEEASRAEAYRAALLQSPYITDVAATNNSLRADYEQNTLLRRAGSEANPLLALQAVHAGHSFFDLLGLSPLSGRVFSPEFNDATDVWGETPPPQGPVVISESAVSYFGFSSPENAVGQILIGGNGALTDYTIIGVVPDYHIRLARAPQKPVAFFHVPTNFWTTLARVTPGGYEPALAHARDTWNRMFPEQPFDYTFLEDSIEAANADDARQSQLFAVFTGLAIFVACLGLFGLASFVAARRTQEIAIRKVLGASTGRITRLLLWDFAKPVLLANIIAWPVAWLLMREWLNGFAYRIELSPVFFVGASAVAIAIAILTVVTRTVRAARVRPAMALKYE